MSETSTLDQDSLDRLLPEWNVVVVDEIDSTNRQLTQFHKRFSPPTLLAAERQTAGKGRGGNIWYSTPGSLLFSLLIDTNDTPFDAESLAQVSLVIAAAIRRGIGQQVPTAEKSVMLKWPNDLYATEKKLCGILLERPVSDRLVIGIGLNVNQLGSTIPSDVQSKAISIRDLVGEEVDRTAMLANCVRSISTSLSTSEEAARCFPQAWETYHLLTGTFVTIDRHTGPDSQIQGFCNGVDDDGALLIANENGSHRILSGTVINWQMP